MIVYRVVLPLIFPAGVMPGAGVNASNRLTIARDGRGRPILRGTALTGAIRHGLLRAGRFTEADASRWFGRPCDAGANDEHGQPSAIRIADVRLDCHEPLVRHHNAIDRHRGATIGGGLFEMEATPPGTRGVAIIELHTTEADRGRAVLAEVVGLLETGAMVGGSSARGIGRTELDGSAILHMFDLSDLEQHAAFLQERYQIRAGGLPSEGEHLRGTVGHRTLRVELKFTIPRGQDLLVADGSTAGAQMAPQKVTRADGSEAWRLPGATLRGVFRSWVSRLARIADKPIADTAERFQDEGPAQGDQLGWGFDTEAVRKGKIEDLAGGTELDAVVGCPVMRLFGSLYSRGRVHVSDALAELSTSHVQQRMHVAVDRLTGGANDGLLFQNDVLVASGDLRFDVTITVDDPSATEAGWLAGALRAIDCGLLRIGSSRASGRLALAAVPVATGPESELFNGIQPCEFEHD